MILYWEKLFEITGIIFSKKTEIRSGEFLWYTLLVHIEGLEKEEVRFIESYIIMKVI